MATKEFNGSQQFYEHPQFLINIKISYLKKTFTTIAGKKLDASRIT
jgi:hypothetical protein